MRSRVEPTGATKPPAMFGKGSIRRGTRRMTARPAARRDGCDLIDEL